MTTGHDYWTFHDATIIFVVIGHTFNRRCYKFCKIIHYPLTVFSLFQKVCISFILKCFKILQIFKMSLPLSSDLLLLLSKSALKVVVGLFKHSAGLVESRNSFVCATNCLTE